MKIKHIMTRLKVWKLTDPQRKNHYQEVFKLHVSASAGVPDAATEDVAPQDRPSQDN